MTKRERDELRSRLSEPPDAWLAMASHYLPALLDAADERDRLAEEAVQLRKDAVVVREGHWDEVVSERDRLREALVEIWQVFQHVPGSGKYLVTIDRALRGPTGGGDGAP